MYTIPSTIVTDFTKIAGKNFCKHDGKHVETLAFLVGHRDGDRIVSTHLVFPHQNGSPYQVEDLGKYWILFKIFID